MKALLFCICMYLVLEACLAKPPGKKEDGKKMSAKGHKNYEAMMKDMTQYGFQPGMIGSPYFDPSFFGAEDHQIKPQKSANRRKTKRSSKSKHQTKRNAQKSN
ncbi:uncharacterized protein LOC132742446 [Ruditapes philippinarum]|uniref:uncharacterized protein LOC132742446 n=1 Tax=Ruditapes philippinarum TaxID=129788 RepID=UPI00295BBAC7|nr:uncharacterized protein LOC132742446 [Ruditapes philippinarum]